MRLGIVLIHGYTGAPEDMHALSDRLSYNYGADSVKSVSLPGHGREDLPVFDRRFFMEQISLAVKQFQKENREIIMIGHSTGGTLALSFLQEENILPALVILVSVPKRIDPAYPERWKKHRTGMKEVPFSSIALMISMINSVGVKPPGFFPALIVHGKDDELVPSNDALEWEHFFDGRARSEIIPSAGHDIFNGVNKQMVIDIISQTIKDIAIGSDKEERTVSKLISAEPEVQNFLCNSPGSSKHLAKCPSGRTVIGEKPLLLPIANNEPVFANIEITTRCNLRCRHCSRSFLGREGKDMSKEVFERILDSLPNAYRVTLVGLGEPLLHPDIAGIVSSAVKRRRRVALVTNAMNLDKNMSLELISAGLHSIAFSIDAADQNMAEDLREGTDLNRVIGNIKAFIEIARSMRDMSIAVFSAISARSLGKISSLIDIVSELGVNVLMMTDLNFEQNASDTLWKNIDERGITILREAVLHAFSKKLPVLSVHGLEEFGLAERYKEFLLLPPDKLYSRSVERTWCYSPWQTVPVNVQGDVTVCDCQPEKIAGNLLGQSISEIWNNEIMKEHRQSMLGNSPPKACSICPRF